MYWNVIAIFHFQGFAVGGSPSRPSAPKVKNRNNFPIHAPIYIKFGKKVRNSGRNMPIKFYGKILNISRVILNLRFGHVTSKIRKFAPLDRIRGHVTNFFV